jgi:hypothetical protein
VGCVKELTAVVSVSSSNSLRLRGGGVVMMDVDRAAVRWCCSCSPADAARESIAALSIRRPLCVHAQERTAIP